MFKCKTLPVNMNIVASDGTEILVRNNELICDDKYKNEIMKDYSDIISSEEASISIEENLEVSESANSKRGASK